MIVLHAVIELAGQRQRAEIYDSQLENVGHHDLLLGLYRSAIRIGLRYTRLSAEMTSMCSVVVYCYLCVLHFVELNPVSTSRGPC